MEHLNHSGTAAQMVLTAACSDVDTLLHIQTVQAGSLPAAPFVITIDRNLLSEEKAVVTAVGTGLNTLTVTRGFDGTLPVAHAQSAVVEHTISATEMQWFMDHIYSLAAHGVSSQIVGADEPQTLTNKVINGANNEISLDITSVGGLLELITRTYRDYVNRQSPLVGDIRVPNEAGVPTGTVIVWTGSDATPPQGWLKCDGAEVDALLYDELYDVIGNKFLPSGEPVPTGTFFLPNFNSPWPNSTVYIYDGLFRSAAL